MMSPEFGYTVFWFLCSHGVAQLTRFILNVLLPGFELDFREVKIRPKSAQELKSSQGAT